MVKIQIKLYTHSVSINIKGNIMRDIKRNECDPIWYETLNYYERLGVSKEASEKEIRTAYKKLVLVHHPDKGGQEAVFKLLNEAHECLNDQDLKSTYDSKLASGRAASHPDRSRGWRAEEKAAAAEEEKAPAPQEPKVFSPGHFDFEILKNKPAKSIKISLGVFAIKEMRSVQQGLLNTLAPEILPGANFRQVHLSMNDQTVNLQAVEIVHCGPASIKFLTSLLFIYDSMHSLKKIHHELDSIRGYQPLHLIDYHLIYVQENELVNKELINAGKDLASRYGMEFSHNPSPGEAFAAAINHTISKTVQEAMLKATVAASLKAETMATRAAHASEDKPKKPGPGCILS